MKADSAGLRSEDGRWTVSAYGRNVLDRDYITSITTYLDTRIKFTGMPAVYGVSA
ncbi:MAG: TonB-dependent receptor, partial [Gammaproteobacteria bacterium]|nr:TonB-dependent receptor [Gammaproteobacteria bacterium]